MALLLAVFVCGALSAAPTPSQPAQSQTPTFRSAVDLVAVAVQVIDREGVPIGGLKVGDFEVWINGRPRKVVSADLITYPLSATIAPVVPSVYATVAPERPPQVTGRMVVLAIDEASLAPGAARAAAKAARAFVNGLPSEDVVGVFAFPFGSPKVDLQHDRTIVARALDRVTGRYSEPSSEFSLAASEIIDIASRDARAFEEVGERQCPVWMEALARQDCLQRLSGWALARASDLESQYMQSLGDLRELLRSLGSLPGRKIVLLVSGGMAASDRMGGRPDVSEMLKSAVEEASASDAVVYALHLDSSFLDAFSASARPLTDSLDTRPDGNPTTMSGARFMSFSRDSQAQARSLERLAGEAGGTVFRDQVGAGEIAYARILRETTAYYLLGVEPVSADRDGKIHFIRTKVKAKNATVRARTQVLIPRPGK